MEKRKLKIKEVDLNEDDKDKDIYTFVIPNSKMNEIKIKVDKKEKKCQTN